MIYPIRNDVISFHGYPPDYKPDYIRHVHRKMYLVPYQGTEVILAHFDVSDCKCGSSSGPFKLECSHEELEVGFGSICMDMLFAM